MHSMQPYLGAINIICSFILIKIHVFLISKFAAITSLEDKYN